MSVLLYVRYASRESKGGLLREVHHLEHGDGEGVSGHHVCEKPSKVGGAARRHRVELLEGVPKREPA